MNILVLDIGGSHIKVQSTAHPERIKLRSGPTMTAAGMVAEVKKVIVNWVYDAVTIGYPGPVLHGKIVSDPHNLGRGWVGYDFRKAFGRRVRIINDAAMQALGSYKGKRMLFLGLGTGLGSAMIFDGVLAPMELGHLPYQKSRTFEEYVGEAGLKRFGKGKWRSHVNDVVLKLKTALEVDYVILGGGNARLLKKLPDGVQLGKNTYAFRGGYRVWKK